MPDFDRVHPFLFEHLDIRGAIVCLEDAWQSLRSGRDYPLPVANLLGEMSAVTTLIAANLKQAGRMTFQLRGAGPVNRLVLDCDERLRLRGMAHWQADSIQGQRCVPELLGHGQLALTLDTADMRVPYQSLVPLTGDSVADIFEHYLAQSEQLPTRLLLAADAQRAAGLFLQKLPNADARDPDGWNRVEHLLATWRPEEMLALEPCNCCDASSWKKTSASSPPAPSATTARKTGKKCATCCTDWVAPNATPSCTRRGKS